MKRRDFSKIIAAAGAGAMIPWHKLRATAFPGLSDPALQPKFATPVPDALAPSFKYDARNVNKGKYKVGVGPSVQMTGLIDPTTGAALQTPIFGYGDQNYGYTWPGRTFEVMSGNPIEVTWTNDLVGLASGRAPRGRPAAPGYIPHLLPVDTSLHWAYSLHGYERYSLAADGIPIVVHLHGGHTDFQYDGNPEFFFSPGFTVRGPQWVEKKYVYHNDQQAGNLWYHDHALGITRLNVYAGMAGFYFVRDNNLDTGYVKNAGGFPVWPYEKAYAIQDRMFKANGELFYPAFPGDPFYDDFVPGEGVDLTQFPQFGAAGGPTALAEFFGDHMVVNGAIWPYENVEPRNYRLRLLNGTDSRFMGFRFRPVPAGATDLSAAAAPLPFTVIGSDQGLASAPTPVDTLVSEPGSRYDVIVDFSQVPAGYPRVILENILGDAPFGGDLNRADIFVDSQTDRIMAFDVVLPVDQAVQDVTPVSALAGYGLGPKVAGTVDRYRKVALFEGKDEFGRLQPLLGTAEPATDYAGNDVNWPASAVYQQATFPLYASDMFPGRGGTVEPLTGPMSGSIAWHSPTTENPALDTTEEWEVWNMTGDAHPVHLHLVHFEILGRQEINYDSNADEDGFIPDGVTPAGDGAYLVPQPTVQHNSVAGDPATYGMGFKIVGTDLGAAYGASVPQPAEYVENAPKDMVTALPGQITRIKATFDKPGRYVWHCHILSHEDHEMMRVMHVGPGA